MNAITKTYAAAGQALADALRVTAPDKRTAQNSATFGSLPPVEWVEDVATGKRVGWMRPIKHSTFKLEWSAGGLAGMARDKADALEQIGNAIRRQQEWEREPGQTVEMGRIC